MINSLIQRLNRSNAEVPGSIVIVQPAALYLLDENQVQACHESKIPTVDVIELNASDWEGSLLAVLKDKQIQGRVDVVLHSGLYHSYQIETPKLPKEEWPAALPFLLKELISERVTDVVADAFELPSGGKAQAYVVRRQLVVQLAKSLTSIGCELGRLTTEEEVWGESAGDNAHFLLLQRSKGGQFRISAYQDHQVVFQRTLRGVIAPVTGVASAELQLDGLALELQRSIDYLSSQVKGISFHQLHLCCDEEQQSELIDALNDRLSVKALPLVDTPLESGVILASTTARLKRLSIDLYPAHLKPKKALFTLTNVVIGWSVAAALFIGIYAVFEWQNQQLQSELAQVNQQRNQLNSQRTELTKKLDGHRPSAEKVAAVERLKTEVSAMKAALNVINDFDESQQVGYSGVMRSLSELGRNDISLSSIYIDKTNLDLKGLARTASSVPNWVNQFKQEVSLVGRSFEELNIGRNEDGIVTFELKTQKGQQ
ncbi:MSHA biogenesis protein MshI [Vibrio sp. FNV 38]|nr:MSHA biogenesis protein MshI [Vibrio sp. FNV 38]